MASPCSSCKSYRSSNFKAGPGAKLKDSRKGKFQDWWFRTGDNVTLVVLLIVYIYSAVNVSAEISELLFEQDPDKAYVRAVNNPVVFSFETEETFKQGYVEVVESQGYGGPMNIAIYTFGDSLISEVRVISHKETQSFFVKVVERFSFLNQYDGKPLDDYYILNMDVDAVSGATVTSNAINKGVRTAAHDLGIRYNNLNPPELKKAWVFGWKELVLIGMFVLAYLALKLKNKKIRYFNLVIAFVFIGFYLNASISVGSISTVAMGFLPTFYDNIFWYMLVFGAILSPLLIGKNLYCTSMCPFHATQIGLHKIGGMRFSLSKKLQVFTKYATRRLLFLALIIIFITDNPSMGSFEPFSMAFSLEGRGIQWYILPATLIGALFISDFFCRYYCPVGESMKFLLKTRSRVIRTTKKIFEKS